MKKSKIIVWNGPLGVFEFSNFAKGSYNIMEFIGNMKYTTTVIGSGDTSSCCINFNLDSKMNHVSTGGGASLTLLEEGSLVGIDFINNI